MRQSERYRLFYSKQKTIFPSRIDAAFQHSTSEALRFKFPTPDLKAFQVHNAQSGQKDLTKPSAVQPPCMYKRNGGGEKTDANVHFIQHHVYAWKCF